MEDRKLDPLSLGGRDGSDYVPSLFKTLPGFPVCSGIESNVLNKADQSLRSLAPLTSSLLSSSTPLPPTNQSNGLLPVS